MAKETAALEALRMCRRLYPWRVVINEVRVQYRHNVPGSTSVALGMVEALTLSVWKEEQELRKSGKWVDLEGGR